jgi:endonuclease YncB( thermonuclease family)
VKRIRPIFSLLTSLLLAAALLTGCGGAQQGAGTDSGAPAPGAPAAGAPAGEGCLAQAPKPPKDARKVTVSRVVDGDTVELSDGTKVRLIGMNTPESVDPRRPVQAFGKEASNYAKTLLEGKQILLDEGRTQKDKYGRTLAWLWLLDGRFVNALLVRDGYAQVYTFSDNPDNAELLLACQREARDANRGLWALDTYKDGEQASQMDRGGSSGSAAVPSGGTTSAPASGGTGNLTLIKAPGTVAQDATASVTVKTSPGAACTIDVRYKSGSSNAKGLEPAKADAQGQVTWSWKIGSNTAVGVWPVIVQCGSDSVQTTVNVK